MGKIKEYINIADVTNTILDIYKEERDDFGDENLQGFIESEFDDEFLSEEAEYVARDLNRNMCKYLHRDDHRLIGNFCNIDWDYKGNVKKMINRLDNGEESEEARADRDFLTDWMWQAFGTYNLRYNFQTRMSERVSDYELEEA